MFGSVVLEVMIGLAGVFLVFSLVVSGVREVIAKALQTRSKQMWAKLSQILDAPSPETAQMGSPKSALTIGDMRPIPSECGDTLSERLARHAFIQPIDAVTVPAKKAKTHHISTNVFTRSLLDLLAEDQSGEMMARIGKGIKELASPRLKRQLQALIDQGADDIASLQEAVGKWYDTHMEALSALYRRRTRWVSFFIGVALALLFNVNAIAAGTELWQNTTLREAAVTLASNQVGKELGDAVCEEADDFLQCVEDETAKLIDIGFPFGWTCSTPDGCEGILETVGDSWSQAFDGGFGAVATRVAGWLAASAAFAVGASFWYDALRRLVSLRGAKTEDAN
jgi:hypothetical protein